MKKLLLLATAIAVSTSVLAQNQNYSPRNLRSEISVSYGAVPLTTWGNSYCDLLLDIFTGSESDVSGWGAVTLGYNYRISKKISLGMQVVYSDNQNQITYKNLTSLTIKNSYWSVMPNIKFSWLSAGSIVSFYSRVGVGAIFAKSTCAGEKDSETHFAFQFSPLGVEVGRRLAGYAEAGIGVSGSILVGARYRF